jgi:hypothetical protein
LRAPFDTAYWIIPRDTSFWEKLKDRYGVEDFLSVSKPLFSKDETKVILITRYYREGWVSGETLLLVKENGTWKYKQQIDYWEN